MVDEPTSSLGYIHHPDSQLSLSTSSPTSHDVLALSYEELSVTFFNQRSDLPAQAQLLAEQKRESSVQLSVGWGWLRV